MLVQATLPDSHVILPNDHEVFPLATLVDDSMGGRMHICLDAMGYVLVALHTDGEFRPVFHWPREAAEVLSKLVKSAVH